MITDARALPPCRPRDTFMTALRVSKRDSFFFLLLHVYRIEAMRYWGYIGIGKVLAEGLQRISDSQKLLSGVSSCHRAAIGMPCITKTTGCP